MSHSWLQRKRKGELVELAQRANLPDADSLLKDDLVAQLEEHLEANETTYGKVPDFRDFYGRSGSPVKRERGSPSAGLAVTKSRRRTLVKSSESEEPTPEKSALITRTPRAVSRVASRVSQVDIPASPAQLAEVADQSFQVVKTKANELWTRTKIDEAKEWLRENASSVGAIQTLILVIEAIGFQYNTLKTIEAFKLPPSSWTSEQSVNLPDGWVFLTSSWWAPATLWALTSWALPLIASYFFNLTLRSNTHHKSSRTQSAVDPLVFNIVRAILAYSAYRPRYAEAPLTGNPGIVAQAEDLSWGPFSEPTVRAVATHVPGGYYGLQIGAVVGIIVSLYDAALKK